MTGTLIRRPKSPRVLVTGSLAFDHIMDYDGSFKDHILQDKAHVINISFLIGHMKKQRGGCAANIAYSLALLGEKPLVVAAAGRDFSEYRDWLRTHGVDVSGITLFDDEMTASCHITTDRDKNQITGFHVGAMKRAGEISLAKFASDDIALAIVAPDDPGAMIRHCAEALASKVPLFFDPSFQVTAMNGADLWACADGASALVLNDYEYAVFQEKTKKSPADILAHVALVIVTHGKEGSRIYQRGAAEIRVKAADVAGVVDPTGAGDAYRSGFISGLLQGFDLATCGQLGSVASAYAIENLGPQNHSYTKEQFLSRYEKNFGSRPSKAA